MRVLLATDRSSHSQNACDFMRHIQFRQRPDLHITNVVPVPMDSPAAEYPIALQSMMEDARRANDRYLAELAKDYREAATSVEHSVRVGLPSHSILKTAGDLKSELVVVGAVGQSAIARVLLGSVSDFVATHADCSTIVVRPGDGPSVPKRILLALSSTEDDELLVRFLEQFLWPDDTEVHLLHVMKRMGEHHERLIEEAVDYWSNAEKLIEAHADSLKQPVSRLVRTTRIKTVTSDHIGEAIVRYSEENQCDLVVIGDSHRGFLNRVFLGSTSRYVLRHVGCTVAIAR